MASAIKRFVAKKVMLEGMLNHFEERNNRRAL
jgi:hypothetical protein